MLRFCVQLKWNERFVIGATTHSQFTICFDKYIINVAYMLPLLGLKVDVQHLHFISSHWIWMMPLFNWNCLHKLVTFYGLCKICKIGRPALVYMCVCVCMCMWCVQCGNEIIANGSPNPGCRKRLTNDRWDIFGTDEKMVNWRNRKSNARKGKKIKWINGFVATLNLTTHTQPASIPGEFMALN